MPKRERADLSCVSDGYLGAQGKAIMNKMADIYWGSVSKQLNRFGSFVAALVGVFNRVLPQACGMKTFWSRPLKCVRH